MDWEAGEGDRNPQLGQYVLEDVGFLVHTGQAEVEPLVLVGEPLGLNPELVEEGGVKIAHVHHVLLGIVAKFVGVSVGDSALDSSARHPDGKAFDVMIPSVALSHGGASEFSAPDNERIVEHAPLLEVLDEGGGALVNPFGHSGDRVLDPAVVIPSAVVKMNEAHAALGQPSG